MLNLEGAAPLNSIQQKMIVGGVNSCTNNSQCSSNRCCINGGCHIPTNPNECFK